MKAVMPVLIGAALMASFPAPAQSLDAPLMEILRIRLINDPDHAPDIVAGILAELDPANTRAAGDVVSQALSIHGNSRAAIHAIVPAAALAAPQFAEAIASGCLRNAPHYISRQEVCGLVRESLLSLDYRPDFIPISPGGLLNPAGISGHAVSP